jgi:hypothetical protein
MRRSFLLLVAALAVSLSGCGGIDPRPDAPPPRSSELLGTTTLGQVKITYEPTPAGKAHFMCRPALDPVAIQDHAARFLAERSPPSRQQAQEARNVLEVSIDDATIHYDGQTGVFAVKVAVLVCLFPFDVPNYFISSDRYTLVAQAHWRLVEPLSGHALAEGDVAGRQSGRFGDLSRGWYFLGFLRVPDCLDDDGWREIADALRPGAQEAVAEAVVLAAEGSAGPSATAPAASNQASGSETR